MFDAAAKSDAREALAAEFAEEDFTLQQWEDMVDIMMATRSKANGNRRILRRGISVVP